MIRPLDRIYPKCKRGYTSAQQEFASILRNIKRATLCKNLQSYLVSHFGSSTNYIDLKRLGGGDPKIVVLYKLNTLVCVYAVRVEIWLSGTHVPKSLSIFLFYSMYIINP